VLIVLDTLTDRAYPLHMPASFCPSRRHIDPEILDVWTACLAREAADLDLSDADDRATFRGRVHTVTEGAVCVLISALARALGTRGPLAFSRAAATRALADAWIARSVASAKIVLDARPLSE
jgi:hypothetical protein